MCNVYLVVAILLKSMNFNIYPDAVPYLSDFLILIYLFYSKHDSVLFYNISKLLHYNPQHALSPEYSLFILVICYFLCSLLTELPKYAHIQNLILLYCTAKVS